MKDLAIYIHIPYCDQKCIYCDFYSITNKKSSNEFIKSLLKEIESYSASCKQVGNVTSIFFGGGTPSLLQPEEIEKILSKIKDNYSVDPEAEITMESNPGTLNENKLSGYLHAGVNRLSIGIQSFIDKELKYLSRIHNSATAIENVKLAAECGFENINVDLIFGLPEQSIDDWRYNLSRAVELPITHISTYSLIVEENTPLYNMVKYGKAKILPEDEDALFYNETINFLTKNSFRQYEVSNFAKEGFTCRHNLAYWHYKNYLSFGPSAHSFINGKRWKNYSSVEIYNEKINAGENPVEESESISKEQMIEEYLMMGLRADGICIDDLNQKFGSEWLKEKNSILNELENKELLVRDKNKIALTSKGYAICDEILLKLF